MSLSLYIRKEMHTPLNGFVEIKLFSERRTLALGVLFKRRRKKAEERVRRE
jgi:hypothetical protein